MKVKGVAAAPVEAAVVDVLVKMKGAAVAEAVLLGVAVADFGGENTNGESLDAAVVEAADDDELLLQAAAPNTNCVVGAGPAAGAPNTNGLLIAL